MEMPCFTHFTDLFQHKVSLVGTVITLKNRFLVRFIKMSFLLYRSAVPYWRLILFTEFGTPHKLVPLLAWSVGEGCRSRAALTHDGLRGSQRNKGCHAQGGKGCKTSADLRRQRAHYGSSHLFATAPGQRGGRRSPENDTNEKGARLAARGGFILCALIHTCVIFMRACTCKNTYITYVYTRTDAKKSPSMRTQKRTWWRQWGGMMCVLCSKYVMCVCARLFMCVQICGGTARIPRAIQPVKNLKSPLLTVSRGD